MSRRADTLLSICGSHGRNLRGNVSNAIAFSGVAYTMDTHCVTNVYPMDKSANYRVRVEPDLHQDFLAACRAEDQPAAQIIRRFMRRYVQAHQQSSQADMFVAESREKYNIKAK